MSAEFNVRPLMALPTTAKFIAATEAEIGFALPGWLSDRLHRANGGTVEVAGEYWELFSVFDTTDRKHIARSTTNIPRETASAREWVGFPHSAVAIACNGGGDYLILLPESQSRLYSSAYRWRHDTDEPPVPVEVSA